MSEITLDMNVADALLAYGALEAAAAERFRTWRWLIQTHAPEDEQEAAKVAAASLARTTAALQAALYPPCDWFRDECDRPRVRGERYCAFHLARIAETAVAV